MRRLLVVLFLALALGACGGDQKTPPAGGGGADAGAGGPTGFQDLTVPPAGGTVKPVAPPPVDPEAAAFEKAERLIESSDAEDRAEAIVTLRATKNGQRAGALVAKLLFDRDEDVRGVAAEAIGHFDYPAGAANLRTLLTREENALVRKQALQSLCALAKGGALPDLVRVLADDMDTNVKATAASLLGTLGSAEAVDPLVKSLENEFSEAVQLQAVTALNRIGAAKAAPAVAEALQYESVLVRAEAAKALGTFGDKKMVRALVEVLRPEEDSQVLTEAANSLVKLTGEDPKRFGLGGESSVEQQGAAVKAWQAWWKEHASEY